MFSISRKDGSESKRWVSRTWLFLVNLLLIIIGLGVIVFGSITISSNASSYDQESVNPFAFSVKNLAITVSLRFNLLF